MYGADIRPDLHSFQLSISNIHDNKVWEPNVTSIESRYRFYRELKLEEYVLSAEFFHKIQLPQGLCQMLCCNIQWAFFTFLIIVLGG